MATPVKAIELSKNLSKFSTDLYQVSQSEILAKIVK